MARLESSESKLRILTVASVANATFLKLIVSIRDLVCVDRLLRRLGSQLPCGTLSLSASRRSSFS